jgi:ribosome biogenesis GTPase
MSSDTRHTRLESLGWTPFFEAHWHEHLSQAGPEQAPATFPARVVAEERGLLRLATHPEDGFWGELTGRARHSDPPAVGDWVVVSRGPSDPRARIHAALPRRTCLTRRAAGRSDRPQVLAANVDVAFLVAALHADFNPRRIERYLTTVWDGGARPVVLLTKLDLCDDPDPFIREIEAIAPGVEVHALSALTGAGVETVASRLAPGETSVLLGSSGTGKSTLINRLMGEEVTPTLPIRESDGRGKHATTSRHLWALPSGALLIDTPGMRVLQLWTDTESLGRVFGDVEGVARGCRFTDCRHESEPGCAVREALRDGTLPEERLASYVKLGRELAFQARKADRAEMSREKERWKRIHRESRVHVKRKRWDA